MEEKDCTFQPVLSTRKNSKFDAKKINIKSVKKYCDRQKSARDLKKQREKELRNRVGSGSHWTGQLTVP